MGSERNLKIILADDDPDDRELFVEAAVSQGGDVDSVPNGIELMKSLSDSGELPDLIFIDLNMPEKSGKECLGEIRQNDRFKNIPVIVYSTSSSKKDIDETFDLGASLYIVKPNSFSALKNAMRHALGLDFSKKNVSSREGFVLAV